ncbi:MAG: LptF/LptG family permease, partial [Herminiimonas sp.]|nr:LptF/LptG family permease [Herminiimonas sp.]
MSTRLAGFMLAKIGVVFLVLTFLFGEFIAPVVSEKAESMKLRVQGALISQQFRSGLWAKDVIKQGGVNGEVIGSRFVNAREVAAGGQLKEVVLYEFDTDFRLDALIRAKTADYQGNFTWRLSNVSETRFAKTATNQNITAPDMTKAIFTQSMESKILVSEITPKILSVLFADPNRMSAYGLFTYTKHLAENNQDSGRYNIAFWKKIIYPFAVFVMMALALPFAYLHFRAGGVSLKIFSGIMLGVTFYLLNNLFSHLGLLNTWPAFVTAIAPSLFFLLVAVTALWWVERH